MSQIALAILCGLLGIAAGIAVYAKDYNDAKAILGAIFAVIAGHAVASLRDGTPPVGGK